MFPSLKVQPRRTAPLEPQPWSQWSWTRLFRSRRSLCAPRQSLASLEFQSLIWTKTRATMEASLKARWMVKAKESIRVLHPCSMACLGRCTIHRCSQQGLRWDFQGLWVILALWAILGCLKPVCRAMQMVATITRSVTSLEVAFSLRITLRTRKR